MQKNIKSPINLKISKVASDAELQLQKNQRYSKIYKSKLTKMVRIRSSRNFGSRTKIALKSFDGASNKNIMPPKSGEIEKMKKPMSSKSTRLRSQENWHH